MVAPPAGAGPYADPTLVPAEAVGQTAGLSRPGATRHLRPGFATAVAAGGAVAGFMAWTTTGSRLVLFLAVAAAVALGLDLAVAVVATRRTLVALTTAPGQAFVGDRIDLGLDVRGPRVPVQVRIGAPSSPAVAVDPPQAGVVQVSAGRRGVLEEVTVEVACHGLCGLVGHARRQPMALRRPVVVGPRPRVPPNPLPEPPVGWGEGRVRPSVVGDVVMGVRPYLPGDPPHRIHWPATARSDDLVVKEVEEPVSTRLVLAVDLGAGGDRAEEAARRAAWYGREALARGYELILATVERGSTVVDVVGAEADLHARLARAQTGRVAIADGQTHLAGSQVFVVGSEGDEWR